MIPPTYMLMRRSKPLAAPVGTDVARPMPSPDVPSSPRLLRVDPDVWAALAGLAGLSAYAGLLGLLQ